MRKNIRWWDRGFRLMAGMVFVAWAIAGGPYWAYLGFYPMATGAWGFSPLYYLLKINSRERA